MKKILLSAFLLLLTKVSIFSMFVVGRQTSNGFVELGPDHELQSRVYETLMTYQYPMNLILLPQKNFGSLFEPVANGEQNFLRSKLQEISPDLDIAYISTTLWELYALNTLWQEFEENLTNNNFEEAENAIQKMNTNLIFNKMNKPNATRRDVHEIYYGMNFLPHIKHLYLKINDIIVSELNASSKEDFEKNLREKSVDLSHKLIPSIVNHSNAISRIFKNINPDDENCEANNVTQKRKGLRCDSGYREDIIDGIEEISLLSESQFLDKIILAEIVPHPQDKIWLYRVTELVNSPRLIYSKRENTSDLEGVNILIDDAIRPMSDQVDKLQQHGLSYGGSMFSAVMYDEGACVYSYVADTIRDNLCFPGDESHYQPDEDREHDMFDFIVCDKRACAYSYMAELIKRNVCSLNDEGHQKADEDREVYVEEQHQPNSPIYYSLSFLYRISLHKNEARQYNDCSNFVIHPINLLVHLLSEGTHYHVWTKKTNDFSLDNAAFSNASIYTNDGWGGLDYSKLSVKLGNFLELNRDIAKLLAESELLAVDAKTPSAENISFWKALQANQQKHSELLQKNLDIKGN